MYQKYRQIHTKYVLFKFHSIFSNTIWSGPFGSLDTCPSKKECGLMRERALPWLHDWLVTHWASKLHGFAWLPWPRFVFSIRWLSRHQFPYLPMLRGSLRIGLRSVSVESWGFGILLVEILLHLPTECRNAISNNKISISLGFIKITCSVVWKCVWMSRMKTNLTRPCRWYMCFCIVCNDELNYYIHLIYSLQFSNAWESQPWNLPSFADGNQYFQERQCRCGGCAHF